MTRKQITNWI